MKAVNIRVILLSLISFLSLMACRVDKNDPKNFPTADSFSPAIGVTGDTITVSGANLKDVLIEVGGVQATIISNNNSEVSFLLKDEMSTKGSFQDLRLTFYDGSKTAFSQKLIVNHIVTDEDISTWLLGVPGVISGQPLNVKIRQLLVTDFDGHGIRTANTISNKKQLSFTQFSGDVKDGGVFRIDKTIPGVIPSPAGGNFFHVAVPLTSLSNGANGFGAELVSNTGQLNDRVSSFPRNFLSFPGNPFLPVTKASELKDFYLNFLLYTNNKEKSLLYVSVQKDEHKGPEAFSAPRTKGYGTKLGLAEWTLISIPFSDLKDNYASPGTALTTTAQFNQFATLNKLKFAFNHLDKKDEDAEKPETWKNGSGDIEFNIDQIIITQGGKYILPPNK